MSEKLSVVNIRNRAINYLRQAKRDWKYNLHDLVRIITQQQQLSEVVNQKEIRIIGLRRSGNHAIINWIRRQATGVVRHLNKVHPHQNPYRYLYQHYPKEPLRQEALGNFAKKDCLLYSYEDYGIQQVTDRGFERKHDLYLGKSEIRYDLLLLRDPFNLLASRLQKNYMQVRDPQKTVVDMWIDYAKEYLGETEYLKNNKTCVNYNRWFMDVDYRQQVAEHLKLEFSDAGIDEVKGYGGGSSFAGR